MSCNGCRVLRKGCSETCVLRPCLQWIESAESQGNATVFVAKFFGRAGLMSFISAVPENQRPSLFQSLLFEAAGRTVNPVNGAVGLLGTGNWHVCQAAVQTVLRGGVLKPMPEFLSLSPEDASDCTDMYKINDLGFTSRPKVPKRARSFEGPADLDLSLSPSFPAPFPEKRRVGSPSMTSEESVTTSCGYQPVKEVKLLNLFN